MKRHWRVSDLFQAALAEHLGFRTKRFGFQVYQRLLNGGVKEKQAAEWATAIAEVFGKNKKMNHWKLNNWPISARKNKDHLCTG
nr:type I-E CRISPR-associated protein Cas7/Cse4/CasC [Xenorhabdus nematophila]